MHTVNGAKQTSLPFIMTDMSELIGFLFTGSKLNVKLDDVCVF